MMHDIDELPETCTRKYKFARSLTGVDVPLVHVTDPNSNENKKNILITGRIHPGESNSSHVLKGFM